MIQDIKLNINKIDGDLKSLFENVFISEKTDRNKYFFSISANKMFLFEGCKKRVEVKVNIDFEDIKTNIVKWSYSLNPLTENAETIERVSYLNNIANDIYEIASNKRMVKEYFDSLEAHVDLILENEDVSFEKEGATALTMVMDVCKKYGTYENAVANIQPDGGYIILTSANVMPMSDKFRIEKELLATEKVAYVSFYDAKKEIKITL